MAIEKIKILGVGLELPVKQHCQFSPSGQIFEGHGLDWQCYLAGSSKTAPRILIFSIAIGADYSFDIKSGFSILPAFSLHNNFDIASVICNQSKLIPILSQIASVMYREPDQIAEAVMIEENVVATILILSGTSVIDVIKDTMDTQTVKVGLTVNNIF